MRLRTSTSGSIERSVGNREEQARKLIRERLRALRRPNHEIEAFASASPGADILFHEVCDELGIKSIVCLPFSPNVYSREVFGGLVDWRNRFIKLCNAHEVLTLTSRSGLPSWLIGTEVDPWERGNQWVFEHGLTRDADTVRLLVLWDGASSNEAGGTDHMVNIAERAGNVEVEIIDSKLIVEQA